MDVGVIVLIALIGFILSGGEIKVVGLLRRRRLERHEIPGGRQEQLDE
jgi:hypothetical protein